MRRWSRRSFVEYGRYWIDGARLPYTGSPRDPGPLDPRPGERGEPAGSADTGRGMVMALPHVGSWEWGGAWLALEGMPMTAVVERIEPDRLFEWFVGQRPAMGLTAVPLGEGSSAAVLKALRAGDWSGWSATATWWATGSRSSSSVSGPPCPAAPPPWPCARERCCLPVTVYSGPGNWHTGVVHRPLDTTRRGRLRADVQRLTQELATIFEGRHPAHIPSSGTSTSPTGRAIARRPRATRSVGAVKIAMLSPYSLSRPGGVQGQVLGLSRALRDLGHRGHRGRSRGPRRDAIVPATRSGIPTRTCS